MLHSATRPTVLNVPNCLTFTRILAVPALVLALHYLDPITAHWTAFAIFALASLTDWLDGYLARIWSQQSLIGAMFDPIADKLLVGATLMMLIADGTLSGTAVFAAVIILCREILVSGLREFLAGLQVRVLVTQLAKLKTVMQMVALALLLAAPAVGGPTSIAMQAGLVLLWLAAILTLWTGSDYLSAAIRHATSERND